MLMLTRRLGESIYIDVDSGIRVRISAIQGRQVRLGIECPSSITVLRHELLAEDNTRLVRRIELPVPTMHSQSTTTPSIQVKKHKRFGMVSGRIQALHVPDLSL